MAKKNIFHDIVPAEKRSIRNIKITTVRGGEREGASTSMRDDIRIREKDDSDNNEKIERQNIRRIKHSIPDYTVEKAPKKGVWFLAFVCFTALVFSILYLISTAEINLTIKKFTLDLNDNISAAKTASDSTSLLYSSVSLTDTDSAELTGSSQKDVSIKATGVVTMYNTQSTSQILISKTRLQTAEGLIFLIDKKVTIPAQKTVSGVKTPGSIDVSVTASMPGDKYNVGTADLTVVAYKSDPKFNEVYGKPKKPIGGGALGTVPVVSDKDVSDAKKDIDLGLTSKILASARTQIPADSILMNNLYTISIIDLPQEIKDGKVIVKRQASFIGYIFDKKAFVDDLSKLKKITLPINDFLSIDESGIKISGLNEATDTLRFNISGQMNISYNMDINKIKEDIKGKSKSEVMSLFDSYESVEKATIKTYPLWLIPRNTDRITVNVN